MDAGWQACYHQIGLMLGGTSSVYTPDESISDIADSYAPASAGNNPANWASIVAAKLGLSPSDPLTAVGGSVAQTPVDSSTGLVASDSGTLDISTLLPSTSGISLTDDSGNLTVWAWAGIALLGGAVVWAVAG